MSQVPRELIRQVQICTRSAAGLPNYNPSDPALPALPPLSAAIAASDHSSPHQIRCKNCKGMLLRGLESIICVYCGLSPRHGVVPDSLNFTSTIGYQWLLRSLHLDGSEMVDATKKSVQNQGYNSPKALIPLSDFLDFKIPWPAEIEMQETTFPESKSDQSEVSMRLTGVAPDKFFLRSTKNVLSDMPNEQPFMHNQIGAADWKDVGYQNLFQNVQSSEPTDISSKQDANEVFSGWEADFQSADSENQHEFPAAPVDSGNKSKDQKLFDLSTGLGVNLAAHIDSVFGSGKDLNDGKSKDNPTVSPAFDDWNSDDLWNNLSSNNTITVSTKNDPEVDHILRYSKDSSFELFQDFHSQTNYTDKTDNNTMNEENETTDEDSFEDWNDFTGSTSLQFPSPDAWAGVDYQVSTSDNKSLEMDLFSFGNKSEKGDFASVSQPDLFAFSTSNSNAVTQVNAIVSEDPASD
ncbi:hypothetical protein OROGR_012199 [Orobanche gracilis]